MNTLVYTNTDLSGMAKKQFNFRLDEGLIKELQKLAKKENRSLTNYIETLCIKAVEEAKRDIKK